VEIEMDGSIDDATIAEIEAGMYGLQVPFGKLINNCDFH
jgi:hypothetical protein